MRVYILLTSLIILIGCSNELEKCIDANTSTTWYADNEIDKYLETIVKIEISDLSYTDGKWLYDDLSEKTFYSVKEKYRNNRFGVNELRESEKYVTKCVIDTHNWLESEINMIKAFGLVNIDDVDDWQTIEDGYVDIIKNYTKDCIENNKVTKERAKLICNTQGIY